MKTHLNYVHPLRWNTMKTKNEENGACKMTKYIENKGIKPTGIFYTFTQAEIDKLVVDFVKEKTGFVLDLTVGCLDEIYDVYLTWRDEDEDLIYSFEEFETLKGNEGNGYRPLYLSKEEDFLNRDSIFEKMFGTDSIGYACEGYGDKVEYTFTL